ncbi:MAG TPA: adenylate/guanylate cyclase domain-containing protein [Methylomirabilota bacterium]
MPRRPTRFPVTTALLISLLIAVVIVGVRATRLLESSELAAYDWYLRLRPATPAADPRVLVVTMTERDIQTQGAWPLPDEVLTNALEVLLRHEPRVIGLDIYRDVPVPPGTARLNRVLADDRRIVVVTKFGEGASDGVRPPAAVADPERIGFNDIIVDPGGIVRRGLLFLDDGTNVFSSFALRLALPYLRAEGVDLRPAPEDERLLRLGPTTIRPLGGNDGGYVRADDRGYQFLLDFKGGDAGFRSIDLTSVLTGKFDPALVSGKIVLVGATAESIKDSFYTPFSRGRDAAQDMPGVVVHAQSVSQLLRIGLDRATPMRTLREWQDWVWTAVWSLAGGLLALAIRSPWWFAVGTGAGLVGIAAVDFAVFLAGWWIPLVPPAAAWVGSAAVVVAYMSYREAMERSDLMKLFSRQVSQEVAEAIWERRDELLDGGRLKPQRLVVTALFTDMTGFTPVAEKLSPEALMDWINEYMDTMTRQVARYGGVVRQYAGDAIVVLFGVPVPRQSDEEIAVDAVRAVDCALAMDEALRELNSRWRAKGWPPTGMRIGIFTGPALAGSIGSADRSEYVVMGDTMNTAARLESFDKTVLAPDPDTAPCRILIGEPTLAQLGDRFKTEPLGNVSLKGKDQTVGLHRVICRAHDDHPPVVDEASAKELRR